MNSMQSQGSVGPENQGSGLASLGVGTALGMFGYAAFGLLELLTALIVTRAYGAAVAGVFFSWVAIFTIVLNAIQIGPNTGLVRNVARLAATGRATDIRRLSAVAIVPVVLVALALGVVGIVLSPSLSEMLTDDDASTGVVRGLAIYLPFGAGLMLALAVTRGLGRMAPTVAVERLGIAALRPILVGVIALGGSGGALLAIGWGLPFALLFPVASVWAVALMRDTSRTAVPRERTSLRTLISELWGFSLLRSVAALFEIATRWIDVPLVAALASPAEAGIYAVVSRTIMAGRIGLEGTILAISPRISSLVARREETAAREAFRTSTWWTLSISLPIYGALALYAPTILDVFGPGFSAGADALRIIAVGSFVNVAMGPITAVLLMEGRARLNVVNSGAALAINLALNVLLIPPLGIEGAAIAWGASLTVANMAPLVHLNRSLGYTPLGRGFGLVTIDWALAYGVVGAGLPAAMGLSEHAGLVVTVFLASPLYLALLWHQREALSLDGIAGLARRRLIARAATVLPWGA